MTLDEAKLLLPTQLKYPLTDKVLDNLLSVHTCTFEFKLYTEDSKGFDSAILAALIELKERRRADGGRK